MTRRQGNSRGRIPTTQLADRAAQINVLPVGRRNQFLEENREGRGGRAFCVAKSAPIHPGRRDKHSRQAGCHWDGQVAARVYSHRGAGVRLDQGRAGGVAGTTQREGVGAAGGALVAEDGDDLRAGCRALAHGDGVGVGVEGVVLFVLAWWEIGMACVYLGLHVSRVLGDRQAADLVCGGDPGVQRSAGGVSGQPGGLAVSWVAASAVVLFLSGVDDGDTVAQEDEGDHVLSLRVVARVAADVSEALQEQRGKTHEAKRGLSWFSMKLPRSVGSLQLEATELIML